MCGRHQALFPVSILQGRQRRPSHPGQQRCRPVKSGSRAYELSELKRALNAMKIVGACYPIHSSRASAMGKRRQGTVSQVTGLHKLRLRENAVPAQKSVPPDSPDPQSPRCHHRSLRLRHQLRCLCPVSAPSRSTRLTGLSWRAHTPPRVATRVAYCSGAAAATPSPPPRQATDWNCTGIITGQRIL